MFRFIKSTLLCAVVAVSVFSCAEASNIMGASVSVGTVLNLRTAPSSSADVADKLQDGTDVIVIGKSSGWYKVIVDNKFGYLSSDYVVVNDGVSGSFGQAIVSASAVNLRLAPNIESEIVTKLYSGAVVDITGAVNDWFKVSFNGQSGYVYGDYLDASYNKNADLSVQKQSVKYRLVSYAKAFLGTPYVRGGTSPSGFDCSGFTKYVFAQYGVSLSRTAAAQYKNCTPLAKDELSVGDLVFFRSSSSSGIGHVGIYIGDGQFIHSSSPGDVVKIDSLSSKYYSKYYLCSGRVSL